MIKFEVIPAFESIHKLLSAWGKSLERCFTYFVKVLYFENRYSIKIVGGQRVHLTMFEFETLSNDALECHQSSKRFPSKSTVSLN